jgi:hypothetical protein
MAGKRGRPATGRGPVVSFRVQPEILALIDEWAAASGVTRSWAIRWWIERGPDEKYLTEQQRELYLLPPRKS